MSELKRYIGTKLVQAEPAWRVKGCGEIKGIYPTAAHPIMPVQEAGEIAELGYRVVYEPDGYESWSPIGVFEAAYRPTNGLNFGLALEAVKLGKRIARAGWNGKRMYVFLAQIDELRTDADLSDVEGESVMHDCLVLRDAHAELEPGWLASQADMLADDWYIVE